MKNIFYAAYCAGILLLGACGKKDASLIGLLPVKPIVNPATGVLIKGTGLVNVQMDSDGSIRGLSDSNRFQTSDSFGTFEIAPVQLPAGAQYNYRMSYTSINGLDILSPVYDVLPTTIGYSTDYGTSWHAVTPDLSGEPTAGYFSWQLEGLQYQAGNILMVSTQFADNNITGQTQYTMLVFKVDPASGQTVKLAEKLGYAAESMQFTSPDTGYIILDTFNVSASNGVGAFQKGFFSRTTDGGSTWSQPVALGVNDVYKLVTGPDGRLLAYDPDGPVAYSTDAGLTWKTGNIGEIVLSAFIAGDNTIYVDADNGVIKTTNFGSSWTPITTPANYINFSFVDENRGIAYSNNKLYSTTDGGATWKTLLYPYSYVTQ